MVVQLKRKSLVGPRPDQNRGSFAGYTEHRYGPQHDRQPYLSTQSRQRIFAGKELTAIVATVAEMLRPWRFNRWEKEGAVLDGLRAALVAEGHPYSEAEREAEDIIRRAFNQLGRGVESRPTFEEGQPEATIPVEHCQRCGNPLDDDQITGRKSYCSVTCAASAKLYRNELWQKNRDSDWKAAYHLIRKDNSPPRPCAQCGEPFRSPFPRTKYCSQECAGLANRSAETRQCENCGRDFKHHISSSNAGRFCSPECASTPRHKCTCEQCGTDFMSVKPDKRFCSDKCYFAARYEARKRVLPVRPCKQCGTAFLPTRVSHMFCSDACSMKHSYLSRKAKARDGP